MTTRSAVIGIAIHYLDVPYIWGGNDPHYNHHLPGGGHWGGLDCSGFIRWIYRQVGQLRLKGDWGSDTMYRQLFNGPAIRCPQGAPGGLAFYGKPDKVSHVMLTMSPLLCIGAVGGNSSCTTPDIARKRGAGVYIRPIDYRKDLVRLVDPLAGWEPIEGMQYGTDHHNNH